MRERCLTNGGVVEVLKRSRAGVSLGDQWSGRKNLIRVAAGHPYSHVEVEECRLVAKFTQ